jgi:hypothetical protein
MMRISLIVLPTVAVICAVCAFLFGKNPTGSGILTAAR